MCLKRRFLIPLVSLCMMLPIHEADADLFGGDVAVLAQILAETIQQLAQLQQIMGNGRDTLDLLHEINRGDPNGIFGVINTIPKFSPGTYGDMTQTDQVRRTIERLYGTIPQTADTQLQQSQDQSVAESLAMHGNIYRYADQVDLQSQDMLRHAQEVNPQGAGKLQAQSLAVLIGVTTQLLRTNSAMLKLMAENLALSNRREKLNAEQFRMQYDGLSNAFSTLPTNNKLPTLGGPK